MGVKEKEKKKHTHTGMQPIHAELSNSNDPKHVLRTSQMSI